MIKLIAGLGNPGLQYAKTRHNVGFLYLDHLLNLYSGFWSNESKFHGIVANCLIGGNKVILLKPQTFMNRSGLSIGSGARYYKFKTEEILIIHDELDFSAGTVKLKNAGGHAGHNGLRDTMENLGEKDFYRLRLGIGRPVSGKPVSDYVLSNPSKEDQGLMLSAFDLIDQNIDKIVAGDMAAAMRNLNNTPE
jgi:PTH1 family peptidyl-tRNA hydrolase